MLKFWQVSSLEIEVYVREIQEQEVREVKRVQQVHNFSFHFSNVIISVFITLNHVVQEDASQICNIYVLIIQFCA